MKKFLSTSIIAALTCSNVYALDLGHDITLKGFGTLGIVNNSTGNADFVTNPLSQPRGAGSTESLSLNPESRIGLQMDWKALDRLSFTAQAVSKQDANNTYVPELQLAFAKIKILSNLDIRAGRIRPAFFMLSDYLDMFYANPWVRPPSELYSLVPIASHMEGVDLMYRPQTGPVSWLIQPYYGNTKVATVPNASFTGNNMTGININANYSDFTLRGSYTHLSMNYYDPGFIKSVLTPYLSPACNDPNYTYYGYNLYDPALCQQQQNLSLTNSDFQVLALGGTWDNGDYFISGEVANKQTTQSNVIDMTAGYVSGGARFGKFTPYVTYSASVNNSPTTFSGGTGANATLNNHFLTSILSQFNYMDQDTKTLGVRYDFYKNLDLKVQWDRIDTSTKNGQAWTGIGLFTNTTKVFANTNNAIDLFSASVDFVF